MRHRGAADAADRLCVCACVCTEGSVTSWRDCLDNVGVRHAAHLE